MPTISSKITDEMLPAATDHHAEIQGSFRSITTATLIMCMESMDTTPLT